MNGARHAALASLLLLPLVWLWPCVFGGRTFVPYDLAQFPPTSITASDAELAAARDGANFDVTEVPTWFVPELELARDELLAGRFPGWNPHARTGAPLHAHGLIGLFYPPNWLALFADEPAGRLALVCWCNLALAGLLAFGLFRQLGMALLPAWVGAVLFELSGPMAANGFFWMRLGSLVWLPGVLWAMVRIADEGRARPLPVLALATTYAMPWLAGFPPFAATTTVFAGIALLWLLATSWRTNGHKAARQVALPLIGGLALGACIALPQVLPSLLFFPESARLPTPLWRDIAGQAFEPYGLLGYLMPEAFGHPTTAQVLPYQQAPMQLLLNGRLNLDGTPALPNYNFTEYTVFVSTPGLLLAVLGLLSGRGRRSAFARAALGLGLMLGLFWPGMQLLFHLPIVQNVWPMRWPAAATLFVCWLAAVGCERLLDVSRTLAAAVAASCAMLALFVWHWTSRFATRYATAPESIVDELATHYASDRQGVIEHVQGVPPAPFDRFVAGCDTFAQNGREAAVWLCAAGVGIGLLGFLRRRRHRQLTLFALATAAAVQLGVFGAALTRGAVRDLPLDSPVHTFLRERAAEQAVAGGFTIVRTSAAPTLPIQLPPGELMARGVRDLNFYSHADARTLQPVRLLLERALGTDAAERIASKGYLTTTLPAAVLAHPLFDLLGVRYALATEADLPSKGPLRWGRATGPTVAGRGAFYVYERPRAMPRAFVVPRTRSCVDDDEVLAAITDDGLLPRRQAFVVGGQSQGLAVGNEPDTTRMVTFVRDDPTCIELEVGAGVEPFLVLADTWLPGWSATVDGEPVAIVRANHSQRLVALPPTGCHVVFTYSTPGLWAGFAALALALATFALWWIATRRRDRQPRTTEPTQAEA